MPVSIDVIAVLITSLPQCEFRPRRWERLGALGSGGILSNAENISEVRSCRVFG
jgi:hypothetical protein